MSSPGLCGQGCISAEDAFILIKIAVLFRIPEDSLAQKVPNSLQCIPSMLRVHG